MFCSSFGPGGFAGRGFYGPHFPFMMMIPMLIILVLVIYFIYRAVNNKKYYSTSSSSSKALEILNERFARGEISEEEYTSKKNQILK